MIDITFTNFEKKLSATFVKEGKQLYNTNAVRELDEEEKNKFVAFVDEGDASYDVQITFAKDKITEHTCDCTEEYYCCAHQIAVLLKIKSGNIKGNTGVKAPRKKKEKPSTQLLNSLSHQALITYVEDLFARDKTIELEFTKLYNPTEVIFTLEEYKKELDYAVKTVVGKRKKIVKQELKKLQDLIRPSTNKYVQQLITENNSSAFINLIEVISYNNQTFGNLQINSKDQLKIADEVIDKIKDHIIIVRHSESFETWVGWLAKRMYNNGAINIASLLIATHVVKALDAANDAGVYVDLLLTKGLLNNKGLNDVYIAKHILPYITKREHAVKFEFIDYYTEYNHMLLNKYIETGVYYNAIEYCKKHINLYENYRGNSAELHYFYFNKLVEIYTITKDDTELLKLYISKKQALTFEEYLYVLNTFNFKIEEDKKKFIQKTISKLAENSYYDKELELHYFKMLIHNKMAAKLFEKFNGASLANIVEIALDAIDLSRDKFLQMVLYRSSSRHTQNKYGREIYADQEYYDAMAKILVDQYKVSELQNALRDSTLRTYYNGLINFMKNHLDL